MNELGPSRKIAALKAMEAGAAARGKTWRLYGRFMGRKRFAPINWRTGLPVASLIHATIFSDAEKSKAQKELDTSRSYFEWRKVKS